MKATVKRNAINERQCINPKIGPFAKCVSVLILLVTRLLIVLTHNADEGILGAKGRDRRLQSDAALRLITQRKVDMVAAWSVDRLGQSLQHLVDTLNELKAAGADLYLHKQAMDTTTPAGRAMLGMLSVFADFERDYPERVVSGMQRAKVSGQTFGRPKLADGTGARVRALRAQGRSLRQIAQEIGCGLGSVQRALAEAA